MSGAVAPCMYLLSPYIGRRNGLKPHFRYHGHVWSCATFLIGINKLHWFVGYGYEIKDAWEEWKKEIGKNSILSE